MEGEAPSTFSIVALDPATGDLGVAVASKFLAVGSVVPWVEEGIGAIATQSYANTSYGPKGLALLRGGSTPQEAAKRLLDEDPERDFRQLGIVDSRGRTHAYTGKRCLAWAGSRAGETFTVQGNILVSEKTLDAMAQAFVEAKGELAERLLRALDAGEEAGGDSRGKESAALVVARKNGGYGGFNGRYVDLRVDDHPSPVAELNRLLLLHLGKDPVSRARRLEHEGQQAEARKVLDEALRRNPAWSAIRFDLAALCLRMGDVARAKAEIDLAIASDPLEANNYFRAARVLAEAGRTDEAVEMVRKTLALNTEYVNVFRREIEGGASPFRPLRDRISVLLKEDKLSPSSP